jgi:hypothetical protein
MGTADTAAVAAVMTAGPSARHMGATQPAICLIYNVKRRLEAQMAA